MTIIIGIDPGKSGGIASWDNSHSGYGDSFTVDKMPATEMDIASVFAEFCLTDCHAYIEKVHAMPGQGVTSMFTFGQGYGFLRGCLVAHGIPFEEVTPRTWQKSFGMKKSKTESQTQWKNRLKGKAQQLFPHLKVTLATCDALLICEFGRRLRTHD